MQMSSYFTASFFTEIGFTSKVHFQEFARREVDLAAEVEKVMVWGVTESKNRCIKLLSPAMSRIKKIEVERKAEARAVKVEEKVSVVGKKRVIDLSDNGLTLPAVGRIFKTVPYGVAQNEQVLELEADLEISRRGYDRLKREYEELGFERDSYKQRLKSLEEDYYNLKSECEIMQSDNQSWSKNFEDNVNELMSVKKEKCGLLKTIKDLKKDLNEANGVLNMFASAYEKIKRKQ